MIFHPDWGWGAITDIQGDRIFLRFQGFGLWVDRDELPCRIPKKYPAKSEAEVFKRMGYAVPET